MNHKRIVAGMSLMLCASAGVLPFLGLVPSGSLGMALPMSREPIRIELPPVRMATADFSADLEAAAILREGLESPELSASGMEPGLATATGAPVREQGRAATPALAIGPDGLLNVNFDLSQMDMLDGSSLDVRKVVRFNGAEAGQVTIRVGAGSALFVASEDLRSLLSEAGRIDLANRLATGPERPFVGFEEVRRAGLDLRYDATSDRILFTG